MVKHKFFLACVGVSILIAAGGCPRPDPEPDLSVSSSSVVLDGVDDTAIFDVSNTGESGSTLTFNVSADAPWVVFDHDSGESTGATDIDTFTVSVDESMVAKAVFEGTITISSNGGTETVDVTLNVEDTGEIIPDTNLMTETGLTAGGISTVATQKLTGTVPNPGGVDATTFEGSAFLVINGDKIPLSIQAATAKSGLVVEKEGETQWLDTADAVSDEELEALPKQGDTQFVFQVTFSINAGPNTLRIEVYDLEDSLFARTADWELTGAITPTSVVITLFWDTDQTDIDLHVNEYDEDDVDLGHVYYSARNVADMVLDFDDTNGFGPEHVTVDDVVGTKRFVIRVYYYADHNDSEQTTPTPVHVTAEVAGEQVLNESSSLSSESTASGWTTGAHVWEAGEVEASGANVYSVTLTEPDLSSWPTVSMQLIVVDEEDNPVDGLTDDEIFVINSGTKMEPVTVGSAKGAGLYDLTFTDVTAGKRDVYVYVYKPAENPDDPIEGGLSNSVEYGSNYALLVGLNEYPAAQVPNNFVSWFADAAGDYVQVTTSKAPDGAGDFTLTFSDSDGGTNRPDVSVTPSMVSAGPSPYRLDFVQPANYADYDGILVTYKKQSWLQAAVKDVTDVQTALTSTGLGHTMNMWDAANFTTITNSGATEAAVTAKIAEIAALMQKYDLFYFHFSGHGTNGAADATEFLCAYEDANWISVTDLSTALAAIPKPGAASPIANIIIGLDACYTGNFIDSKQTCSCDDPIINSRCRSEEVDPEEPVKAAFPQDQILTFEKDLKALAGINLFVMTAVPGTTTAWDDTSIGGAANPGGNGVFTYFLKEGISTGGAKRVSAALANADHNTWVTAEEAFTYLDPKANARVTAANGFPAGATQDPQVRDNDANSFTRLVYCW